MFKVKCSENGRSLGYVHVDECQEGLVVACRREGLVIARRREGLTPVVVKTYDDAVDIIRNMKGDGWDHYFKIVEVGSHAPRRA